MLEKPDLPDHRIAACLQANYGLSIVEVVFLPLGADRTAAVYRAVAGDESAYFVKLRRGLFDEIALTLPKFLSDQGISAIIPPLVTKQGQLWADLDPFTLILYPFIEGRNGYQTDLSAHHWHEFGQALRRIHTAAPPTLTRRIRRETFSPQWRDLVKHFFARAADERFADPVAAQVADLLQAKEAEILDLMARAERHARALRARPAESVVCHSDIHAGNVLIGVNDAFYMVDWDNPILAPKERDLMYAGGGQGFTGHSAQEEEILFYQGYGQTPVDPAALAYYRYERIIEDIALFCEQLLLSNDGGVDREQSLRYLRSNFLPNGTIEVAYRSDKALNPG